MTLFAFLGVKSHGWTFYDHIKNKTKKTIYPQSQQVARMGRCAPIFLGLSGCWSVSSLKYICVLVVSPLPPCAMFSNTATYHFSGKKANVSRGFVMKNRLEPVNLKMFPYFSSFALTLFRPGGTLEH